MNAGQPKAVTGRAGAKDALRARATRAALVALALAAWASPRATFAAAAPIWVRLELVENTAEGPAFERCRVASRVEKGGAARWRVVYGEARSVPDAGWTAIRARSSCGEATSGNEPGPAEFRGAPYLLVDVALSPTETADGELRIEASLATRRLTGFAGGAPSYQQETEKRVLRVPAGGSASFPLLIASQREKDEFRLRELLFRVRARELGAGPRVDYGEIAVAADVPRAEILLDGGPVGRTPSEGSVVIGPVRSGEREVVIRDPSGREARATPRVEKGRRADVALSLLPPPPSKAPAGLRPIGPNAQRVEEFCARRTERSWSGSPAAGS